MITMISFPLGKYYIKAHLSPQAVLWQVIRTKDHRVIYEDPRWALASGMHDLLTNTYG